MSIDHPAVDALPPLPALLSPMKAKELFMIFYITIIAIYGVMHYAVYRQFISFINFSFWGLNLIRFFFAAMALSPFWSRWAGFRTGLAAGCVYFWMGLVFYLFLVSLATMPLKLALGRDIVRPLFFIAAVASAVLCLGGLYWARTPVINEVVVKTAKLPPGDRIDIALISDVHLLSVEGESRLQRVLDGLKTIEYDLLLSAGDFIEVGVHEVDWAGLVEPLSKLKPRLGKFAVMGNHETYANRFAGRDAAGEFHEAAGFKLLNDGGALAGPELAIVGIMDDGRHGAPDNHVEDSLLAECDPDRFIILLKHRPTLPRNNAHLFDLMISGHTHNGQMWPFNFIVKLFFPYISGKYNLDAGNSLYVSQGTGTWGPPLRVGTTPEITLFHVQGKGEGG